MNDLREQLEIQLLSAATLFKGLLPAMAKGEGGRVALMLSAYTLGEVPKGLTHYVPVKYAMLGLMQSLVAEFGNKDVVINAISPSMVDTSFLDEIPGSVLEAKAKDHPLGRLASVKDVVPHLEYLLTLEGDYLQGANLPVTGGSF